MGCQVQATRSRLFLWGQSWVERGREWCQVWVQVPALSSGRAWPEPRQRWRMAEQQHTLLPSLCQCVAVHGLWRRQHCSPVPFPPSLPASG